MELSANIAIAGKFSALKKQSVYWISTKLGVTGNLVLSFHLFLYIALHSKCIEHYLMALALYYTCNFLFIYKALY